MIIVTMLTFDKFKLKFLVLSMFDWVKYLEIDSMMPQNLNKILEI